MDDKELLDTNEVFVERKLYSSDEGYYVTERIYKGSGKTLKINTEYFGFEYSTAKDYVERLGL